MENREKRRKPPKGLFGTPDPQESSALSTLDRQLALALLPAVIQNSSLQRRLFDS